MRPAKGDHSRCRSKGTQSAHALPCMDAGRPFSLPAGVAGTAFESVSVAGSAEAANAWKVAFSLQPVHSHCERGTSDTFKPSTHEQMAV